MPKRILPVTLALGLLAARVWSEIPIGPEFQVNTHTPGFQGNPSVAAEVGGGFVVVWDSEAQDGNGLGIFARRYDASGTPVGAAEFRVNSYTTGHQSFARVAVSGNQFVVVWMSEGQDGWGQGIFGRQFNATSGIAGPEFQVSTNTYYDQGFPSVGADAAGNFVVVWHDRRADGYYGTFGIVGQRYDASGVAQGGEFHVNSYTTNRQLFPSVAVDPAGSFVVVWHSYEQDDNFYGVFGQRFDATGAPVGPEFRVNTYTTGYQGTAAVAIAPGGNFVVAWMSVGQDGSLFGVFGQRYDGTGAAQGGEFRVNSSTTNSQSRPSVTVDQSGNFVVAWSSVQQDGSGYGAFAQKFDASGTARGVEFRLNSYTTGHQSGPSVSVSGDGNFVAVWSSDGAQESGGGVFGQRFSPIVDAIFSDGFETSTLAAWSGSATDGGDLSASIFAAMKSSGVGLQAVVDDVAGLYVQDDTPDNENRYRARFYLDPNGFDPGEAQAHRRTRTFIVFSEAPTRRVAAIVLRRLGGIFSLRGRARLDDDTQADTGFVTITDAPHVVEIDLQRATDPDAQDGSLELWIDGTSVATLAGLDNSLTEVDFVRMGALSVKTGARGTIYWDEFDSRRFTYIGP